MLRIALTAFMLAAAGLARAGLTDMRATIPGSLHQCEKISVFFFDTQDSGSKTLLLLTPGDADKLGDGTVTLADALAAVTPLQKVDGINSADAADFPFVLKLEEKVAFSTFGFLSNGQGKNMKLDRSVMSALPDAENCLSGAAPAVAPAPAPAPAPSSSSAPVPVAKPSSTIVPASSSSPVYASRFVTSTRPTQPASTAAAIPATTPVSSASSASLTLPPSSAPSSANSTAPAAPASTSPVVVQAKYLLTSFITISNESTTDGKITSSPIRGGHITGSVNGTILPIGMALFTPNTTLPALSVNGTAATAANVSSKAQPVLLSASYTFTMDDGESVFVMAQTPLSQNYSSEALLMTFQSSFINSTQFANLTVLGKPESINSTMFRIDAYFLNNTEIGV